MKICMPTMGTGQPTDDLNGHFGSAATFVVYDDATKQLHTLDNRNQHHTHGACLPVQALAGEAVDAVLTGGMGRRAVAMMNEAGIKVYFLTGVTIADAITRWDAGNVLEMTPDMACGGHGNGHGCS